MESAMHTINDLFQQLGLPNDDRAIEEFIITHRPLKPGLELSDADFWNDSQGQFLREAIKDDADWAVQVDELDTRLREFPDPQGAFS